MLIIDVVNKLTLTKIGALLFLLALSVLSHADQAVKKATLLNDLHLSVELGQEQKLSPVQLQTKDCIYAGNAVLNPLNHRADIKFEKKVCNNIETNIDGMVSAIDGKAGLKAKCTDIYKNSVGNKVCAEGHVKAGIAATVIEF